MPVVQDLMDINEHEFTYVTSGFHAVTNHYMLETLTRATAPHFLHQHQHLIFNTPYSEVRPYEGGKGRPVEADLPLSLLVL